MEIVVGQTYKQKKPSFPFQIELRYIVDAVTTKKISFHALDTESPNCCHYEFTPTRFKRWLVLA